MAKTVVLDTNVLLSDPDIIFSMDGADLVIPETVLSELDKLKTARVDPDLRFKGREVSRILFELSEKGRLIDGVALAEGGSLRVAAFDPDQGMPEGLSARNADDRILATAYHLAESGEQQVTLVTADLNMLLKAQALGLAVERYRSESEQSWARRYIIRPFQRYRTPLAILAIAVAVFAGIVAVAMFARGPATVGAAGIPVEFTDQLQPVQQQILTYLLALQDDPSDTDTRKKLADIYYELWQNGHAQVYAADAIKHYTEVLKATPDDLNVRTDRASMYFYDGQTDLAVSETLAVLRADRNKVQANFNLGLMYWQGKKDFRGAAAQFEKVVALTAGGTDANTQGINAAARQALVGVIRDAKAAGIVIKPNVPLTTSPAPTTTGSAQ